MGMLPNDSLLDVLKGELVNGLAGINTDTVDYSNYQEDPEGWMKDILGEEHLWDKLIEICNSVRDNPYTAVYSANSVGKTYIAARIALWWNNVFGDGNKVITTAAPPERQIKELLWGELRDAWRKATNRGVKLVGREPGVMSLTNGDNWWIKGFTIPITGTSADRVARFQGHHAEHLLFILDEANGIPHEVYSAVDSCLAGGHNHLLLISNPLVAMGDFYEATKDSKFNVITISAFDHPNVKSGKNIIPGSVTREKTEDRIYKWSRPLFTEETYDSSCFIVPKYFKGIGGQARKITDPDLETKTLAKFPHQTTNSMYPMHLIENAQKRWVPKPPDCEDNPIAGLDVAEFGPDSSAWVVKKGSWVSEIIRWNGVDPRVTGEKAAGYAEGWNNIRVHVDATGVGSGVPAHLVEKGVDAIGIKVGESPTIKLESKNKKPDEADSDVKEFALLRDQLFWAIREWLINDPNAMLPPDPQLAQEMAILTYNTDNIRGKIQVMQKSKIKELVGRSPDALDALALIFYKPKQWKSIDFVKI